MIMDKKKAFIMNYDRGFSAGGSLTQPLQFYAQYGWNDMDFSPGSGHTFADQMGTMHCTTYYNTTCNFSSTEWACANTDDICNNPPTYTLTISPTIPTITPTYIPTYIPTKTPTNFPSESHIVETTTQKTLCFQSDTGFINTTYTVITD
eukprot:508780_1